ncbi:MAG: hypothetical protein HQL38_15800 [Alphaproteobacteria bacterium]|nr:hypothetical protein [Alphaproteobacteria bacterium]
MSLPSLIIIHDRALRQHSLLKAAVRRIQRQVVIALAALGCSIGVAGTLLTQHFAADPSEPIRLTAEQRRGLDLIEPGGWIWTRTMTPEQVTTRLKVSTQAVNLATLVDELPPARSPEKGNWFAGPESGKIGRYEAVHQLASLLATAPPDQRAHYIDWMRDITSSDGPTRAIMAWVGRMSSADRKMMSELGGKLLDNEDGRRLLKKMAATNAALSKRCFDALDMTSEQWSGAKAWGEVPDWARQSIVGFMR